MPHESAIVLVVPAVETAVVAVRARHAPNAARGVPPHITLLYPWRTPPLTTADLDEVRAAMADVRPFAVRFDDLGWFDRAAYLRPADRGETLRLIQQFAARFPEHPPYGGRFTDPVPHLTVAEFDEQGRAEVEAACAAVAHALPLEAQIEALSILDSDDDGMWRVHATLPLTA